MKLISEHLGQIIAALTAVAILITSVVFFKAPIGDFFGNVIEKETAIGETIFENLEEIDFNSVSNANLDIEGSPFNPSYWQKAYVDVATGDYVMEGEYSVATYRFANPKTKLKISSLYEDKLSFGIFVYENFVTYLGQINTEGEISTEGTLKYVKEFDFSAYPKNYYFRLQLVKDDGSTVAGSEGVFVITDTPSMFANKPSQLYYAEIPTTICSQATKIDEVYAIYDDLLASYPDYITKSSIGQNEDGLEIYYYTFGEDANNPDKPVILINAGTHGDEKGSVFATAYFMKDLAEGSRSELRVLKEDVVIKVIPMLNLYGFNNNVRKTKADGSDLNRDFETDAFVETRLFKSFVESNKEDTIALFDCHNSRYGTWVQSPIADNIFSQHISYEVTPYLEQELIKHDPSLKDYIPLSGNKTSNISSALCTWVVGQGVLENATSLEIARHSDGFKGRYDGNEFDGLAIKSGMDLLGNMLIYTALNMQ